MDMTSNRLRQVAAAARMLFGADEVEVGRGTGRSASITLFFNRDEEVVSHGPADGVHRPVGSQPAVVVKEIATNELAADGLGGRGGEAPGETELARPATKGFMARRASAAMAEHARLYAKLDELPTFELTRAPGGDKTELPAGTMIMAEAFIPPDFMENPWSALGRQWPHPESYLDKLRLFRSRENAGDRQVIVTICLAADQSTPEGETDMTDKKTWRRACTCRQGATPESPGLNLGADGVPVCKVCGKPWTLVPKPEKS